MTTEQVQRSFDVVFSGRDYLCVPPCPPRAIHDGVLPPAIASDRQDRQGQNLRRVLAVMPGTTVELADRSGLTDRAVLAVLNNLRRKGDLVSTRPLGQLTSYTLRQQAAAA